MQNCIKGVTYLPCNLSAGDGAPLNIKSPNKECNILIKTLSVGLTNFGR